MLQGAEIVIKSLGYQIETKKDGLASYHVYEQVLRLQLLLSFLSLWILVTAVTPPEAS